MKRNRRQKKGSYKATVAIFILILLMVVFIGRKVRVAEIEQLKADTLAVQLHTTNQKLLLLASENQDLKDKLIQSHRIATSDNVKAITRVYLTKYFGKDAQTAEKVFTCESNLNNLIVSNPNKNGTRDWGIAQINDVHKGQFEAMFPGVKFETGVLDFSMNIQFAKYLYDHQGFGPWTCAKIVNVI